MWGNWGTTNGPSAHVWIRRRPEQSAFQLECLTFQTGLESAVSHWGETSPVKVGRARVLALRTEEVCSLSVNAIYHHVIEMQAFVGRQRGFGSVEDLPRGMSHLPLERDRRTGQIGQR
jgi:hypothetical protein